MNLLAWLKSVTARREKVLKDAPNGIKTSRIRKQELKCQKRSSQPVYPKQRRYKRYFVEETGIKAKMVFAEIVEILDISSGGACIITKKPIKPGDHIVLRITDENINRPLKCIVIWETEVEKEAKMGPSIFHKAGLQFKEIPSDTLIQLKDYMRKYGIPDEKKLDYEYQHSALRFRVYKNEKAVMSYLISYPVKKLSLGGMLVGTDHKFSMEQRYPMAIYLPKDSQPIKFHGRIASKIPKENDQLYDYDIGVEFLNLAETDKSRINKFLALL